jgi:hypothetical protein
MSIESGAGCDQSNKADSRDIGRGARRRNWPGHYRLLARTASQGVSRKLLELRKGTLNSIYWREPKLQGSLD